MDLGRVENSTGLVGDMLEFFFSQNKHLNYVFLNSYIC